MAPKSSLKVFIVVAFMIALAGGVLWFWNDVPDSPPRGVEELSPASDLTAIGIQPVPFPSFTVDPAPVVVPPGAVVVEGTGEILAPEPGDTNEPSPQVAMIEPAPLAVPLASTQTSVPNGRSTQSPYSKDESAPISQPESGAVKRLRDMPSEYRASFPKLTVEVHVYDKQVGRRFVQVNGQSYRQGAQLKEGPMIVEIKSDGVVFNHRGEAVLVLLVR